ncbi:signal peptide peptidase SppA [Legionella quinlivanii]|uniref:Signal peptide peptidase SppA n=1 Tax=Legionella quinlivanii TaxID=45073 RepID=A0A0W0Y5A6_9GAMM|nr:protease SohB [Legionella quinlivanii]KTD51774.1 signal peptide peptidase SppA [Legionella quinlivanii]SEF65948.1 inner membrane peptidase. Serine peptidase. MEROPS family S49 [Legionella quinlivanii DSM 21216]STY10698.1 signal peptide peptidase SppA [Legionella quinlivanii]
MEFLAHYGMFLLKCLTLVISLLLALAGIMAISKKPRPKLEIVSLNKQYEEIRQLMFKKVTGKAEKVKKSKKETKSEKPSLYVLQFHGDIKATEVEQLRDAITAILSIAGKKDEVLLLLESPGGAVNGYGLAASQLLRIRDRNIPLTVCIDKVAASGGYLMACIANKIVAAPFSIVGSIGVVSQIPNFHRWLKKHNVDVELITAGEYKRTLTILGENTEKGRQKFQEDLEKIHHAFREFVLQNREQIDINQVSTGEHWLSLDAFKLKLVDELKTSDEVIIEKLNHFNVYKIISHHRQSLASKILKPAAKMLHPWA